MIAEALIISGVVYASACRLSEGVTKYGIHKGKSFAYLYLSLGLIVKAIEITTK